MYPNLDRESIACFPRLQYASLSLFTLGARDDKQFSSYLSILQTFISCAFAFCACSEVSKALTKTRDLFTRLDELKQVVSRCGNLSVPATPTLVNTGLPMIINAQEELEWTNTEIKNALRSIDWDLEDLEDTIYILFIYNLEE
ncbi:hypothetical protein TKK_0000029 [Trichogramma kaykai]